MRTTVRAIVASVLLVSCLLPAFGQQFAKTIPCSSSPEGIIGFLEFHPSDYGSQKHPLIIFLHGIGERGNGTSDIQRVTANAIPKFCAAGASMRFTVNGQTSSFVVLSPQLSSSLGYWPTFYVKQLVQYAKSNLSIDPNRIYITGLSLGGGGVWRVITDNYNWDNTFDAGIAAVAPVCGTQEESDADFCNTIGTNHLPIWAFHSMDDGTVNVGATQHAEILSKNCPISPAAKFTYYQSGNHSGAWINAYDTGHITTTVSGGSSFTANPNMYEWFLSNSRSTQVVPPVNNTPPSVSAGAAQVTTLPANTVTLQGNGNGTNGASVVSYSWTKKSGGTATIGNSGSAVTTVTGLVQGSYVFTLTATDNHGLSGSSDVNVTVNAASYTPPSVDAGPAQSATLPVNTVTLHGNANGINGSSVMSYNWTRKSGGSATIANPGVAVTTVSGLSQGSYVFTLTVTDDHGLSSSADVSVTVNGASATAPVANAGSAQTVTLPANAVTLSGSGTGTNGATISSYSWSQTSGGTATINSKNAASTTVSNLVQGTYAFTLTVTDNNGLTSSASVSVTVNAAIVNNLAPAPAVNPIGYIKQSYGAWQACADNNTSGRIAVYASSVANNSILYTDAAMTKVYNGGWNWFSYSPTSGGAVTQAFAVFPNGSVNLLTYCANGQPSSTPVNTVPVTPTPAPTPAPAGNLLGYVKQSVGPYQACDDASTDGRIGVYGSGIFNGGVVYTDAALTHPFNGGWNWFSFTATYGSPSNFAFALYPTGGILLLRNCTSGTGRSMGVSAPTTAEEDIPTLQRMKDSANAATLLPAAPGSLRMFPNPVHSTATLTLNSADAGAKMVYVYNSNAVLAAKFTWQTVKGNNTFTLPSVSNFANGLYIIEIKDFSGKTIGTLKFLKM